MQVLVDELAETLIGCGQPLQFVADGFIIMPSEDVIKHVGSHLESTYNQFPQCTKATVDNMLILVNSTLYKLTQLQ